MLRHRLAVSEKLAAKLVALYGKARKWLLRVAFESAERRLHRKLAPPPNTPRATAARLGF